MPDVDVQPPSAGGGGIGKRLYIFYFFVLSFGLSRVVWDSALSPFNIGVSIYSDLPSIEPNQHNSTATVAAQTKNGKEMDREEHNDTTTATTATALTNVAPTGNATNGTATGRTVAYAVSITNFRSGRNLKPTTLYDRAAVLHLSIKNAMKESRKYDYHLYAFVHPDAIEVKPRMEQLGYRVLIRETPVNVSVSQNEDLIRAQNNGCCGEKEWLKLYSWLLFDYPVVVHVDMDYLFLKPMEDVFDIMTDPSYDRSKFQHSSMWTDMKNYNGSIDFVFTRDYNMVNPPKRQPHQIGVQGGFLVVRPNQKDFDQLVSVIESGGKFVGASGWGGKELRYGGYYGAGTIQGLASYYYGHIEPNRAIELNRCYYNTMVDNPRYHKKNSNFTMCRTLQPDLECQDCRTTHLNDIYSAHFTVCGKPEWCGKSLTHRLPLCRELFTEWHKFRTLLEQEWTKQYPDYIAGVAKEVETNSNPTKEDDKAAMMKKYGGHCGPDYIPMVFPSETEKLI